MIKHIDVNSKNFIPAKELIFLKPRELPQGEVEESGFVIEMEQNTSVVDRPTLGKVIRTGRDVDEYYTGKTIIWEERAGQDIILEDGHFLVIGEESVLGVIENIKDIK